MNYRLHPGARLQPDVTRIALAQLRRAAAQAEGAGELHERIHEARTGCKKVRALIRLVEPRESSALRRVEERLGRAARMLSPIRDAEVMLKTVGRLKPSGAAERSAIAGLERRLAVRQRAMLRDADRIHELFAAFAMRLRFSEEEVSQWKPGAKARRLVSDGFASSYRKARSRFRRIGKSSPAADFHAWRKAVKRHGYHCRLVAGAYPELIDPWARELDGLGKLLGSEHDLAVLAAFARRDRSLGTSARKRIAARIDSERECLRKKAISRGRKLFAERPSSVGTRLEAWWTGEVRLKKGE